MEALGVSIQLPPERVAACLEEVGVAFLFAPAMHSAMKFVQPARRELKIRTIFNLLGPLTNPAQASGQVVGVYSLDLVEKVAEALSMLGLHRGFVVHGLDGLDEITLTGPTRVAEIRDGTVRTYEITPEEFGITRAGLDDISGGDSVESRPSDAKFFWGDLVGAHRPVADFGDASRTSERDFIEAIEAVHDEASVQSQHAKSFGNFLDQIKRVHSDYLARRLRRIGERAEQIKKRPDLELAARGLHKFHGRVHRRSKEKRDPDFFQAGGQAFRRKLNVYAESFHHIRRTFFRAHAAVAMLGYAHAGARDHERCCGRDVKRRAGRTAGATGIDERLVAGAADVHCRIAAQV